MSYALVFPRYVARLVTRQQPKKVQILHDFSGLARPGEMILVLGRPGSGCSSLLKVLSGKAHGIEVGEQTTINYAGITYDQMHRDFAGDSIYLAELDAHFPELTLGQTLAFAASSRELYEKGHATAQASGRDMAALFNLSGAFDTKMGNAMIRGVSGGETRRTSIAEALISSAQLQCWDNSTRGLDSATAQQFINLLRTTTDALRSVAIMSIYQASDSMYDKFDKVMLLYEGRQIYFGPASLAVDYFHRLGFAKPKRVTVADFLTSLTNSAERVIRDGFESQAPRTPYEFAEAWKQSPEAEKLLADIASFESTHPLKTLNSSSPEHFGLSTTNTDTSQFHSMTYLLPIHRQVITCVRRGFARLRSNYVPAVSTIFANAILAIVVGSVYYDLPDTAESLSKRAVLIFFSLMICAFSPAFEVSTMWAQRPIVEKHHRYALYHPFAEAVASMICDLPAKLGTSIMFNVTLYFMTNLRRTASAFFTHLLFMFFIVLTMSMVFRTLGSLSRTLEQTMAPAGLVVVLCIVYTGFVIPVPYMKPWLSWFRWINPMAYVYESLMITELQNREFPCSSTVPAGPAYLDQPGMTGKVCPVVGAEPGQPTVQGSAFLSLSYGYESGHLWRNFGILIVIMFVFCITHLVATEYTSAQKSKGEILLFQRGHKTIQPQRLPDSEKAQGLPEFAQDINKAYEDGKFESSPSAIPSFQIQSSLFHWSDLSYEVKTKNGPKKILNGINGWVKPGTMTALMGVTGAGKTTLLDVLANRASFGTASGEVYINGTLRDVSFQRKIGYVQQEDIHLPTATVREALEFSALLRQAGAGTKEEKLNYVDQIINVLDMGPYADAVIGVPGTGLNIEQRKRLSIGVELVAKPELLLFLDEPTSGLDSQTAWSICTLLRKLANHGQAILCTIHQPSSQLFQMFDRLLLLSNDGETAYFGEIGQDASAMIEYVESGGAPKCQPGENPAEWVLRAVTNHEPAPIVTGPIEKDSSAVDEPQDMEPPTWARKWRESRQHQEVQQRIVQCIESVGPIQQTKPSGRTNNPEYSASFLQQLRVVTRRSFQDYWRDPTYIWSKLALCAGVCFLNSISFYNTSLDMQGFTNFIFSIFLITQLFSTLDQQIIPRLVTNRSLFETRERRSKSYSWVVFLTSNIIIELWWQTIASVAVFLSWYYLTLLWQNGDASFVGVGLEYDEQAVQIATLCFWLSLVFCGVLVSPNDLPRFWIFVYRASPLTYFINGLVLAGLSNTHIECSETQLLRIDPPSTASSIVTCGEYLQPFLQTAGGVLKNPEDNSNCFYCPVDQTNGLLQQLGMETGNAWRNVGFMVIYLVFNTFAIYGIYWLVRLPRQKR
ncbi:ABC multidrug transporter C [Paramyrothecium foliicola]|nr:ABC multidrug transporter C [Paramyrothecium foliicola]